MVFVISGSCPAALRVAQAAAVRRSCQTIAGAIARPVSRRQIRVVSRWLVMPMAAICAGSPPAWARASRKVATLWAKRSSGSCSTQPLAGKCWGSSRRAVATGARLGARKAIVRVDVVPWSRARMRSGGMDGS